MQETLSKSIRFTDIINMHKAEKVLTLPACYLLMLKSLSRRNLTIGYLEHSWLACSCGRVPMGRTWFTKCLPTIETKYFLYHVSNKPVFLKL
jgi:hypothetical protein